MSVALIHVTLIPVALIPVAQYVHSHEANFACHSRELGASSRAQDWARAHRDVGEHWAGSHLRARHARTCSRRPLVQASLRRARAQVVSQTRALLWLWLRLRVCMCTMAALAAGGLTSITPPRPTGVKPPKLRHEQMYSSLWRLPRFRGLVSETSECTTPQPALLNRR